MQGNAKATNCIPKQKLLPLHYYCLHDCCRQCSFCINAEKFSQQRCITSSREVQADLLCPALVAEACK
jgi:hypothetical protein